MELILPPCLGHKTRILYPKKWFKNSDEKGLIARTASNLKLIGLYLRELHPYFFEDCAGTIFPELSPPPTKLQQTKTPTNHGGGLK